MVKQATVMCACIDSILKRSAYMVVVAALVVASSPELEGFAKLKSFIVSLVVADAAAKFDII